MQRETTVRQDDSGKRPQLRLTRFFFFHKTGVFSSPHYGGGPILTRNSWGARTTNKDGERHTSQEKMVKYFFFFASVSCVGAVCVGMHTHIKGNIDISHLFFGFLCLKHLAQIYILLAHL